MAKEQTPPNSPVQRIDTPDPLTAFTEAIALGKDAGKDTVRVRCDLRLYNHQKQSYANWPDTSYTLEVTAQPKYGTQLRKAFDAFTQALTERGPAAVIAQLTGEVG